jgi:hypothetical protein
MDKMSIFGSGQNKVSGFIPDILCIPVDSPRASLRFLRIDDFPGVFPGACQITKSSGRFGKYRVKPACWETQDMYFKILTNASNF